MPTIRPQFTPHPANTVAPTVLKRSVAAPKATPKRVQRDAVIAAVASAEGVSIAPSQYAAEIESYLDSKQYRETNIAMRTNRAVGF